MRLSLLLVFLLSSHSLPVFSQADVQATTPAPIKAEEAAPEIPEATDNSGIQVLDVMVVTGVQPGPGMWKVSKGDHVMWIMGTQLPLAKKMEWESRDVEKTIAQSDEVLFETSVEVKTDQGMFRNMLLIPSLFKARKNPNDAELKEVLSPDLYQRWSVLKAKYIGRDNSIEKWRPIFAAQELYEKATEKSGLSSENIVRPVVVAAAEKNKKRIIRPKIEITIEKPKAMIKEFSNSSLEDMDCFSKTLNRLETDLNGMIERGNAWAIGDVEGLTKLTYADQNVSCISALTNAAVVQKRGLSDIRKRSMDAWLAAADTALAKNKSTFALLPMGELLRPTGLLASLRAKGYVIEAP